MGCAERHRYVKKKIITWSSNAPKTCCYCVVAIITNLLITINFICFFVIVETLSQLIVLGSDNFYQTSLTAPLAISDAPRFKWRGLLIDTSRHYLSVGKIKHIIRSMSYIKLNVLHWHIIDAQSFPMVVPKFAKLAQFGAYAPRAVYTPQNLQDIIQFAYEHGIRVLFELDMPGHAASWSKGYPNVCAKCPSFESDVNAIPLSPAVPETFDLVQGVIQYTSSVMLDQFIHFGGDELQTGCWKEDKNIAQFMQQKGFKSFDELLAYFYSNVISMYTKEKKTMLCWQELLLNYNSTLMNLPRDTIVQAWINQKALVPIVQQGYRALLSAGWYLDQQFPSSVPHYEWVDTWKDFYVNGTWFFLLRMLR